MGERDVRVVVRVRRLATEAGVRGGLCVIGVHAAGTGPRDGRLAVLFAIQFLGFEPLPDALVVQDRETALARPHLRRILERRA